MSSEKTLAIVIRVVEFSESSCVVTLFTRDFGKIAALAKGARRPKSPFESALDLLAVCRIVFLHKSSDALDLLTEAKLERRFRAASRDLSRLYAAYYVAELLREMTDDRDPHPELYDAAAEALSDLDGRADVSRVVLRFEMTALRVLGHLPALHGCAACGRDLELTQRVLFGQMAGGLLCDQCRPGQRQVVSMTAAAVAVLQQFAASEGNTWRELNWDGPTFGEVRGVISQYLCQLLDHRPRMHRYLGPLGHTPV
jgi:DNA repair protein RecO (recombination protein O)